MRLGVLTGGGDCPGLNAVLRAMVRTGVVDHDDRFVGFLDAWSGMLDDRTITLDIDRLHGTLTEGGTILGTRRGSPYDHPHGPARVADAIARHRLDALVVIGGNGSLAIASRLFDDLSLPVIGVPKTIDNDVMGTDRCIGFATAVQTATDAIDRLRTTAESHHRVMFVEVMGRHAGWIAAHAGIAGGAAGVLVPEHAFALDDLRRLIERRHDHGHLASIIVVAEGAEPLPGTLPLPPPHLDQFGHVRLGGIATTIAHALDDEVAAELRVVRLGHVQRGGSPVAEDRVLATRLGIAAVDAAHEGSFGQMIAWTNGEIGSVALGHIAGRTRLLDPRTIELARVMTG